MHVQDLFSVIFGGSHTSRELPRLSKDPGSSTAQSMSILALLESVLFGRRC